MDPAVTFTTCPACAGTESREACDGRSARVVQAAGLNPREGTHGNSRHGINLLIGMGHFFARRTEKAAEMLRLSLQENSEWPPTFRFMASCLAHLGRLKEAQELVKQLRAITPTVIPSGGHWRICEDREYFLDGLRLAVGVAPEDVASR